MYNICVAVKVWGPQWAPTTVRIACNNQAVVNVLNSGRTKCPHLASIARNIFMEVAAHDIQLTVVHIPGKDNQVADLLSRWHLDKDNKNKLNKLMSEYVWVKVQENHLKVDPTI